MSIFSVFDWFTTCSAAFGPRPAAKSSQVAEAQVAEVDTQSADEVEKAWQRPGQPSIVWTCLNQPTRAHEKFGWKHQVVRSMAWKCAKRNMDAINSLKPVCHFHSEMYSAQEFGPPTADKCVIWQWNQLAVMGRNHFHYWCCNAL